MGHEDPEPFGSTVNLNRMADQTKSCPEISPGSFGQIRSVDQGQSAIQIEAIQVHDLVPGCHEIVDELLLGIGAGIRL